MRVHYIYGVDTINQESIRYNWAQYAVLKAGATLTVPVLNKEFRVKDITLSQSCVYVYLEDNY